jgi:hypothetical protein
MNRRIDELAHQALAEHVQANIDSKVSEQYLNRFAELLIKECCATITSQGNAECLDDWDSGFHCGLDSAVKSIQKQFGVDA